MNWAMRWATRCYPPHATTLWPVTSTRSHNPPTLITLLSTPLTSNCLIISPQQHHNTLAITITITILCMQTWIWIIIWLGMQMEWIVIVMLRVKAMAKHTHKLPNLGIISIQCQPCRTWACPLTHLGCRKAWCTLATRRTCPWTTCSLCRTPWTATTWATATPCPKPNTRVIHTGTKGTACTTLTTTSCPTTRWTTSTSTMASRTSTKCTTRTTSTKSTHLTAKATWWASTTTWTTTACSRTTHNCNTTAWCSTVYLIWTITSTWIRTCSPSCCRMACSSRITCSPVIHTPVTRIHTTVITITTTTLIVSILILIANGAPSNHIANLSRVRDGRMSIGWMQMGVVFWVIIILTITIV